MGLHAACGCCETNEGAFSLGGRWENASSLMSARGGLPIVMANLTKRTYDLGKIKEKLSVYE